MTAINDLINDYFDISKCLIIAPKNVADDTWTREQQKWDHLQHLRVVKMTGDLKHRIAALESDADMYVINRENVVWLIEYLNSHKRQWPFDAVVIDELSSFKAATSKRWRALKRVIGLAKVVVGLTGTPAPNGYIDLWPQIYLIDRGERLGRTLGEFRGRYFNAGASNGHIVYKWHLKPRGKQEIDTAIKDICLSMQAKDWIELPERIDNIVPVRMSAGEHKLYEQFKKDKVLPLLNGELSDVENFDSAVIADNAAIVTNKLLQMASGAVYDDAGGTFHIHDRKIDKLDEIVEAAQGQPLLVFYSYKSGVDALQAHFPNAVQANNPNASTLTEAHGQSITGLIDLWAEGKIPMLLCHPASAGHGLNLQGGGHIIVWYGLPWSLELYQQANARLHRRGQTQSVIVHHLLCEGTADEQVYKTLQNKDITQHEFLQAMMKYVKEK